MKKLTIVASLLFGAYFSNAQTNWSLDKAHTKLGFAVSHLMLSETTGDFKMYDVTAVTKTDDFVDAAIDVTIDVNSINTDDAGRDAHLKKEDFFDVAKFPKIMFKSKSLKKVDGKKYALMGDLTMHGVTKPVTLDVIFNGTGVHPYTKATVAGFKFTTTVKRTDFGVGQMPAAVVGEDVTIAGSFELIKK
ncbi:MAG: polyisoprenoid-binding protein [Bacteroidetes bacterium]|nr:MAG: polyisoprenoid-binding protein [Bacteroidota bacterium]